MPIKWPPFPAILGCLILFGLGELAGGVLGGLPGPIRDFSAEQAAARPEVHGLTGIPDIDRTIVQKVSDETLSRLHTFHLHGHGIGLLTFVLFMVITNSPFGVRVKKGLTVLTGIGMLYPFGWLVLTLTIPSLGTDRAFALAEKIFFMPFGTAMLLAIWLLIGFYILEGFRRLRRSS